MHDGSERRGRSMPGSGTTGPGESGARSPGGGAEVRPLVAGERPVAGRLSVLAEWLDVVATDIAVRPDAIVADADLAGPSALHDLLSRAFAVARLRVALDEGDPPLQSVHRAHKYLLMAHSPALQKELGRLAAGAATPSYERLFRQALSRPATRGGHANALQHVAGYLRGPEAEGTRRELLDATERYRLGATPLPTVVRLVRESVDSMRVPYLEEQAYLRPYPPGLDEMVESLSGD